MVRQPWGCFLIPDLGPRATDGANIEHSGSSVPSKHIPEHRHPTLDTVAVLQLNTMHHLTMSLPARCAEQSPISSTSVDDTNRQVLASISKTFIIGPSWLVVTCLVVEQLPTNAVRHPPVA